MKLFFAFVVWGLMAATLIVGLLKAVNGSPALLVLGLLGFVALCAKFGCLTHD